MKLTKLPVLTILFFAVGCTGAQMEAGRMQKVVASTAASAKVCLKNIADNPEYAIITSKTPLGPDSQFSLQMLTDGTKPNKREIATLYKVYGDTQECSKIILDGASKIHPLTLLTFVESFAESDKLWAEATSGHLTWGKFNEGRKNIQTQGQARMVQADMQISAQLQNQHQLEIEQRQRAAAAMQQWSYQQQVLANQRAAINAANQPRMINCNYFGTSATCTSN